MPAIKLKSNDNGTTMVVLQHVDYGVEVEAQLSPAVSTAHPEAARRMLERAERLYAAGYTGSEIFKKLS